MSVLMSTTIGEPPVEALLRQKNMEVEELTRSLAFERDRVTTYKELTALLRDKIASLTQANSAYAAKVLALQSKVVALEVKEAARWNAAQQCNIVGSRGGERFLGEEWRTDAAVSDATFPWRNCCATPPSAKRRADYT